MNNNNKLALSLVNGTGNGKAPVAAQPVEVIMLGFNMLEIGGSLKRANPNVKIGMVVAGNAGRAGGLTLEHKNDNTYTVKLETVHPYHTTQEEAIFANAIFTDCEAFGVNRSPHSNAETLPVKWGLEIPQEIPQVPVSKPIKRFHYTKQNVNYAKSQTAESYNKSVLWGGSGHEVRVTPQTFVTKGTKWENARIGESYKVALALTAGPNANCTRQIWSSTTRTFDGLAKNDYTYFEQGVKYALTSSIGLLINEGCEHIIVPGISTGIYATDSHRPILKKAYFSLVKDVVNSFANVKDLKSVIYSYKPAT